MIALKETKKSNIPTSFEYKRMKKRTYTCAGGPGNMTSLTTQRTCTCTLEVTKRHRWAADKMNAEMGTCKNL